MLESQEGLKGSLIPEASYNVEAVARISRRVETIAKKVADIRGWRFRLLESQEGLKLSLRRGMSVARPNTP